MQLKGKTALVFATGQCIGKASALAVATGSATVWAIDVNNTLLASCAGFTNIHTAVLGVMDESAIEKMISGLPAVHVLLDRGQAAFVFGQADGINGGMTT